MTEPFFELMFAGIFVNNIVLAQFLGQCPFLGTSKKMSTATGMSMAVVFVLILAAVFTWFINNLLVKHDLDYLQIVSFILVIASLVQFVEMFLKKMVPPLYSSLGIFLPLITTNCAVMGACLINAGKEEYLFMDCIINALAYAIGFGLALILFAGVRERIILARVPKPLEDASIGLVTAGIIALTFYTFQGMV